MSKVLKDEYIREAAYFIWEKEGRPESDGYEFWMKAIKQLSCDKAACAAKAAPAKKATPVKKAVPVKKAAPVKKVAVKKLAVKR